MKGDPINKVKEKFSILKEDQTQIMNLSNGKENQPQPICNSSTFDHSVNSDDTSSEMKCATSTPLVSQNDKEIGKIKKMKIISFYSSFKNLKEKYGLNNRRRNRIDCIIKKVKARYLKSIHEAIKYCVNLYIHRLPQNFITNIKIDCNRIYFNKTIEQIYTEFNILPSSDELIKRNLIKKDKKEMLLMLMKSPLKDIYKCYLSSELYKYDKMYLRQKEGEKLSKLFDYIAKNILRYFLYSKGKRNRADVNNFKGINNKFNNILISNNFKVLKTKIRLNNKKFNIIKNK